MKVTFIVRNAYRMGGTISTTTNLAGELAERGHDIEVISVHRDQHYPHFRFPGRVRIRTLIDLTESRTWSIPRRRLAQRETRIAPEHTSKYASYNRYTEYLLKKELRRLSADVLISTWGWLNIVASIFAPKDILRIGQEHYYFGQLDRLLHNHVREHYPRLDAVTCLSDGDREDLTRLVGCGSLPIVAMPNGIPSFPKPQSAQTENIVVAMGRMVEFKRYDRLIKAFAIVAGKRPDWRLRIYGGGLRESRLRSLVARMGLNGAVEFMGPAADSYAALAGASIHVLSSRVEGFGMTIVEAFSCGVPVVSFDCPHGPGGLITHGHDGLLVPNNDIDGLAAAMLRLMDDSAERKRLAMNARETAEKYDIRRVADRWEEWLAELLARKRGS